MNQYFVYSLISIVYGLISAKMAKKRNKNPYLWFMIGAFFGLLGILAFFFMRTKAATTIKPAAPIPFPYEPPAIMKETPWYFGKDQETKGPMSFFSLENAWRRGELTDTTLVWNEHMDNWTPLQAFKRGSDTHLSPSTP